MIFLMHYDPPSGRIVELRQFSDEERSEALEARLRLEMSLGSRKLVREVLLLDANDEKALRKSHRRYFESLQGLTT